MLVACALFSGYHNLYRYLPVAEVLSEVNLVPFLFCILTGLLLSSRYFQGISSRFHKLIWVESARLTTKQTAVVALIIFGFMFAFKNREMSRLFVGSYLMLLWTTLLFLNVGLPRFLCRLFFNRSRQVPTVFIGGLESRKRLKSWLASKEMLGVCPVGFISDNGLATGSSTPTFLGTLLDLPHVLESHNVMQVIILETPRVEGNAKFIIEACQNHGCRLLIYSDLAEKLQHPLITVTEEGYQFFTLQEEPLEDPINRVLKRLFDLAVAIPIVVLLLPFLMAIVWVLQRIQAPGRLFFTQERTGHSQQSFRIIKFRSMYENKQTSNNEARQAVLGDQRVYPFGQFLRSTSLDEFPQFINVLKGEMSIVGPRPHMLAHDRQFSEMMRGYRTRFFVKPGITGLAQSRGLRGEITDPRLLERRIKMDLFYVTRWSIWLDLQITLKTAWVVFFPQRTAY